LGYRHRQQRSSKLIGQDRAIGQCLAAVRCQHVCAGQQATDHQRAVHAIRNLSRHFNASARQRPNLQLGQLGDRTAFAGKMRNVAQLGSPQVSLIGKHSRWRAGAHSRVIHRWTARRYSSVRCWIGSAHATQAWWRCAVAMTACETYSEFRSCVNAVRMPHEISTYLWTKSVRTGRWLLQWELR
jgi:hypothetical protein